MVRHEDFGDLKSGHISMGIRAANGKSSGREDRFHHFLHLGHVDKRDSHDGSGVTQAGICHADQLAPTPDERRRMVAV